MPILPAVEHANVARSLSPNLWHQRLGHVNSRYLYNIVEKKMVTRMEMSGKAQLSFCEGCVEGKVHHQPFKQVGESYFSSRKLQLVNCDVCGPMDESIAGKRYYVSFIDDYSHCCAVYFMKRKGEVFSNFKELL